MKNKSVADESGPAVQESLRKVESDICKIRTKNEKSWKDYIVAHARWESIKADFERLLDERDRLKSIAEQQKSERPENLRLLPCPFCGGTAEEKVDIDTLSGAHEIVECFECRIRMYASSNGTARELWNRRASDTN